MSSSGPRKMEWSYGLCTTLYHKHTSEGLGALSRDNKAAWPPFFEQGLGMGEGLGISLGTHLCPFSLRVPPECPLPPGQVTQVNFVYWGCGPLNAFSCKMTWSQGVESQSVGIVSKTIIQVEVSAEESLGRSGALDTWRRRWLVALDPILKSLSLQKCGLALLLSCQ